MPHHIQSKECSSVYLCLNHLFYTAGVMNCLLAAEHLWWQYLAYMYDNLSPMSQRQISHTAPGSKMFLISAMVFFASLS
ncbi:hypothetical protein BD769DRAFT_1476199 [Suillus cothurnatus]|nr:hypothetical protein BD769DRAFT_1476267 [Suillus cothurnatus]KAG2122209.1 hypothetical protein BD769DRAFT_1476199 [Suillus cothurnatus]